MPISAPFARILSAGRPQFNARALEAKRRTPGFDDEAFAAFLSSSVDGLVAAVAEILPDRAAMVALPAYDLALALTAQGLLGQQTLKPLLGQLWSGLFPVIARQIAESPGEVMGALSNAALYLDNNPDLRGNDWLQWMQALGKSADSATQLLSLGKVLAWRAGAAHFRGGALQAADQLPETLALAALGAPSGLPWAEARANFAASPWWSPSGEVLKERVFGNFTGFGGNFSQPPEVRASADGFWIRSGERYSLLIADLWGAVLHPASAEEFASQAHLENSPSVGLNGCRLALPGRNVELDLPEDGLRVFCNAHTAAVTSPYSHRIRLFPLQ